MASFEVLAEESYKELLSLLEWFSHFSLIPALIGGWAVFVYNLLFDSQVLYKHLASSIASYL